MPDRTPGDISKMLRDLREFHGWSRERIAAISGGKISARMVELVESRPYGGDDAARMGSVAAYVAVFNSYADRRTMKGLRQALGHAVRRSHDVQLERLLAIASGVA